MKTPLFPALCLFLLLPCARSVEAVSLSASNQWSVVEFSGAGPVTWEGETLVIGMGESLSGVVMTNAFPTMNYELSLEARRMAGSDFFCGLTFPIATNHCTIIVGGWGGSLLGMSSIDGMDASENHTGRQVEFEEERWYRVRVRVTPGRVDAWLDDKAFVELDTEGRRLHMRHGEIEQCIPLGLATWQTRGEIRNIRLLKLPPPAPCKGCVGKPADAPKE